MQLGGQHFPASAFSAFSSSRRIASARDGMPGRRARHTSMASAISLLSLTTQRSDKASRCFMHQRLHATINAASRKMWAAA